MVAHSSDRMSDVETSVDVAATESVFESLAHQRRRHAIRSLAADGDSMADGESTPVRTLARDVAGRECDEADSGFPPAGAEAVHTALYHQHLPKLEAAGTVEFDREHEEVSLTGEGEEARRVLAFATDGDAEY